MHLLLPAPPSAMRRVVAGIEGKSVRHGLRYPWWIPVLSTSFVVVAVVVGLAQRDALLPPRWVVVGGVLALAPEVGQLVVRRWIPWPATAALTLVGCGWLLTVPIGGNVLADWVPVVLAVHAAAVTCCDGFRAGAATSLASAVVLLVLGPAGYDPRSMFLGELLVGLAIGCMLRSQMRALAAEQAARAEERERATLAERQRVAGEIHDLVAHSLSVTLLHVTGARRALTEDADVLEAIDALTDAERIGRRAMADIRRTVGVLRRDDPAALRPLPSVADLDALVADVRAAGLDVDYRATGDLAALPEATGLGLYRVLQESLANATKHAPGAPVTVRLEVDEHRAHLVVTNPVPVGAVVGTDGSGLVGFASRAEQLGGRVVAGPAGPAGPDGDRWRVELTVPR